MDTLDDSLSAVAQSAVIMLFGSVIGRGIALIVEALIARSLGPSIYGTVSLAYTITLAVSSVLLLGIHQGIPRLIPAADSNVQKISFVRTGYLLSLILGLSGALLMILFSDHLSMVLAGDIGTYLVLLSPFLILYPLSRVSVALLRSWEQTWPAIFSRDIASRTIGLLVWTGLFLVGLKTEAAVVYWVMVPTLATVIALWFIRRHVSLRTVVSRWPNKSTAIELLSFSWPLAMSSIVFLFLSRLDILMIGYFLDSANVGFYRSIQPLRQSTMFILEAFGFVFLPIATRYYENNNTTDLEALYKGVTKWIVIATLPITLGIVLFSEGIVLFLFGESYLPAALPLGILIGGLFIRSLVGLNGDVTKAIDRPKIEFYSAVAGVVCNFVLNIVLIPEFGIVGAAVATVGGYVVYNAVELYAIYSHVQISPFSTNILKPTIVTTIISTSVIYFIDVPSGIIYIIFFTGLIGVVSVLSVPLTRSIGAADLLLIKQIEERTGRELSTIRSIFRF